MKGRSGPTTPWFQSYYNIEDNIWSTDGLVRSPAGEIGALGSRLMQHDKKWDGPILDSAHTGFHLPEKDLRMLTLWMDLGGHFSELKHVRRYCKG